MTAPTIDTPTEADRTGLPTGFRGPIMPMNTRSGDRREFVLADGAEPLIRPLPLPLSAQKSLAEGHDGSIVVGLITRAWVQDGHLWAEGPFDLDDPEARDWAGRVGRGTAGWVSADMSDITVEQVPLDADDVEMPEEMFTAYETAMTDWEAAGGEGPAPEPPLVANVLFRVPGWKLMGTTLVAGPAFESARIEPVWGEEFAPVRAREALVAAAAVHTGAMVALIPSQADCERLAVEGYEAPEVLHTTMVFLGEAADWSPEARDQLEAAVRELDFTVPLNGTVMGHAQFNPDGDNPCAVYLVQAMGLSGMQSMMYGAIADTPGLAPIPEPYDNFLPHITAGYGLDVSELKETGAIRFDRIRLSWADEDVRDIHLEPLTEGLVAAGIVYDAKDFEQPEPDEYTMLTVTDDGRVFGHVAPWDSCHAAFPDNCTTPPYVENDDYNAFHQGGPIATTNGMTRVGKITFGTGHAGDKLGAQGALSHYDNTGTVGALVRCRNGEFGPFVSGRLVPGLSDEQITMIQASAVSGDWRRLRANASSPRRLQLIAVLSVNSPGFMAPPTRSYTAPGVHTLVASAAPMIQGRPVEPKRVDLAALAATRDRESRIARAAQRVRAHRVQAAAHRVVQVTIGHTSLTPSFSESESASEPEPERAAAKTDDQKAKPLERYWTEGKGLAKWARGAHPYTQLVKELTKVAGDDMTIEQIHGLAAKYYHRVFGRWPGKQKGEKNALARAAVRRVETPEGARYYGQPMGSVINTDARPPGPAGGTPFPEYTTNYRATDLASAKPNTGLMLAEAVRLSIYNDRHEYGKNRPDTAGMEDVDVKAVADDVIAAGLNVELFSDWIAGGDLPESLDDDAAIAEAQIDRIGDDFSAIIDAHRGYVDPRPLSPDLFGEKLTRAGMSTPELVEVYSDFGAALDVFDPDSGNYDDESRKYLFNRVLRSGLNVRLVTHPDATPEQRQRALYEMERFYA
ncbi:hypothetical protein GCM10007304_17760 [Rhodococcoides trifolii]|uniref:Uncharacterized protein n=1 Tax=Rhodococcoides trifolii TaxID=908250 RepID=A0A917D2B0_9NOCA|nr:hypothetical protein [Rhodococcus trifolii]GGG04063.1 hypothetical protein GCM10007304_17760 [Rhodococcus trifolii]